MKQVIDGLLYDTETAERVATHKPVVDRGDFNFLCERLYRTDSGRYFLHGEGGPRTSYRKKVGTGEFTGSSELKPLSAEEALEWCERHSIDGETVADEFDDHIENA